MKYCQSGRDSRNQGVGRRQKAEGKADKRGFALKSRFRFAKRTNLIAGGNATGSKRQSAATLKGSDFDRRFFDLSGSSRPLMTEPWALPTAKFNRYTVGREP